ncbi:MAG TPA: sigma-70 family RNA polymerase sigma factor [Streptosporangiaceae bacterium]
MAGWPGISDVDDRRLAEALRRGDAGALTEIYDAYAPQLYEYCHGLLRDQAEAAGALRDSLIAAQEHIGKLREPERFRSWLYAIVRAACLRRRDDPERPATRQEAPEVEEPALTEDERAKLEEQRLLAHSALAGLTGRQREAVDLAVRHELDAEDIAGIFAITTPQASKLIGDAKADLTKALAAAIIARTGHEDCPSVAALVDGWPLTPEVCRKLVRHVENCPTCGERRSRRVSMNRLLQVLPVAALPPDLRLDIITVATAPDRNETRMTIARRAEPFDSRGWPTPPEQTRPAAPVRSGPSLRLWHVLTAAACLLLVVGGIMLFQPGSGGKKAAGNDQAQAAVPSDSVSADPSDVPSDLPLPTASTPSKTVSASPSASKTPTPTPSTSRSRPSSAVPPKPSTPGRLGVSGCRMSGSQRSCTVTVTASGGPVSWRVTGTSSNVSASGGGTLAAGQSASVQVTRAACGVLDFSSHSGSVSFSPNGAATVSWTC